MTVPSPRDALIIPAAGSAQRFGQDKLLLPLAGLPLFAVTLRQLAPLFPDPARRFLAVAPARVGEFQALLSALPSECQATVVPGGETRHLSVACALEEVPEDAPVIAIHDAARPLIAPEMAAMCLQAAHAHGAALLAHRVTDTIKIASHEQQPPRTVATPDRNTLWAAETPQAARSEWLRQAFAHCRQHHLTPTDDAQALELAGYSSVIIENKTPNFKLTHPEDIAVLQALVNPPNTLQR